jgi:hypothetical protein
VVERGPSPLPSPASRARANKDRHSQLDFDPISEEPDEPWRDPSPLCLFALARGAGEGKGEGFACDHRLYSNAIAMAAAFWAAAAA